jgi:uncharacterized membrane protein YhaH (DUF805 family)
VQKLQGIKLLNQFFSFGGRLGRLGFLLRGMAFGIAVGVLFVAGASLFLYGALWWLGLLIGLLALLALIFGYASLAVRRLHDVDFSGYHAFWIGPVQLFGVLVPAALSSEGVDVSRIEDPLLWLVAVLSACLLLWPGTKGENRFGDRPNRKGLISRALLGRE